MPFIQTLKRFEAARTMPGSDNAWRPVPIPFGKRVGYRKIALISRVLTGLMLIGSAATVPVISMSRSAGVIATTTWGWVWVGSLVVSGMALMWSALGSREEKPCYSEIGARVSRGLGSRVVGHALNAMGASGQPELLKRNLTLTRIRDHVRRELIENRGEASEWIERDVDEVLADCVSLQDLAAKYSSKAT